jgi:hypothetical protein
MKGLPALIRLHRWELEQKRRVLAGLEGLRADLVHQGEDLEREVIVEQAAASQSTEASYTYSGYANEVIRRRATIAESIANLDVEIIAAHDEVAEAFHVVKRYEIALERKEERERLEEDRREQAEEAEVALNMYRLRKAREA